MKKIFFINLLGLLFATTGIAQVVPQTQYVFNPYLYNPIWAGYERETQAFLSFRRQWLAVEGAPTLANLTFELPLKNKLRLGSKLAYETVGPFQSLSFFGTAAYHLPVARDQKILFGLSLGIESRSFNSGEVSDPNDPVLQDIPPNTLDLAGNFGIGYIWRELKVSIAFPQILPRDFSPESDGTDLDTDAQPYDYWVAAIGYSHTPFLSKVTIEPQLLYHGNRYTGGQYEAIAAFEYEGIGKAGLSYRQAYGLGIFLGFRLEKRLTINYIYGTNISGGTELSVGSSHDLGLNWRFSGQKL
ncbi:MAG: PorP/SprF family type IX secretion system membrane protein [Bacteroidota bacterium]